MIATISDPAEATRTFVDTLMEWSKAETPWQIGLIGFGFVAQALFFARWLVQWAATERRGESHVPELFWWMSISGACLTFTYYLLRGEPVGMVGQGVGWTVYARNLYLIRRKRHRSSTP